MINHTINNSVSEIDDISWILSNSISVLTMQVGFAVLETGSTKKAHCVNIMLKNLMDMCICCISWFIIGWSIYSDDSSSFIGAPRVLHTDICDNKQHSISYLCANIFFLYTFCSTMVTIVSGAVAERMPFITYILFVIYSSIFIFPILSHWVWNPIGFLYKIGYHDFAGASVVHLSGSIAGLILTIHLKPRYKVFQSNKSIISNKLCNIKKKLKIKIKQPVKKESNSILFNTTYNGIRDHILVILGTIMLWVGWFGFNMGSTFGLSGNKISDAVCIGIITALGGSLGGRTLLIYDYRKLKIIRPSLICGGILSGLVVTTANVDILEIWGIIVLAPIASLIYYYSKILLIKLQIDDPIDAIAIHGLPSILSLFSCSIPFLLKTTTDTPSQFPSQLLGLICITGWVTMNVFIFIWICKKFNIRIIGTERQLLMGFDMTTHGIDPVSELGSQLAHIHLLLEGCNSDNRKLIHDTLTHIIQNSNINNRRGVFNCRVTVSLNRDRPSKITYR
jgi:Amt family ammonium transporter